MNLQDALKLPPRSPELLKEIEDRKSLIREMVGWLYPSILSDEIRALGSRYWEPVESQIPPPQTNS